MSTHTRRGRSTRGPNASASSGHLRPGNGRAASAAGHGATSWRKPGARRPLRGLAMPALLGAAAVAAVLIIVGSQRGGAPSSPALAAAHPVLGRADAPVLIREYGDFQCTSCEAFLTLVEPQLRAADIDAGVARLEWHDFPWIGQESRDAANAARCAGDQGKFWEFHDLLYRSQSGENQGAFAKDRLKAMGAQLGLAPAAFNACVDGNSHADAVQGDFSDVLAQGFNSTPTFLVGSQRIVGAQPLEVFQAAIDAARGAH